MEQHTKSGALRSWLLIAAVLSLAGCASSAVPPAAAVGDASLAEFIDRTIATPPFDHALWGIYVVDANGKTLYAHNERTLMMPASNRKLFSSSTVANCLPADTRFTTTLWRDGEDLVLEGDGDPSLGAERHGRADAMDQFAEAVAARGIKRVRDVVADVSAFDRDTVPASWKVGNILRPYSAPVDALSWRENDLDDMAPAEPGLAAALALRDALDVRGVRVTGGVRLNIAPRTWTDRIAAIQSPMLVQLLPIVLKNSNNVYAEMLFKRAAGGAPVATYAEAFRKEREFLTAEAGLDPNDFRFVDGSGLSPEDMVAPEATVGLLRWMNHPARRNFWIPLLATPGEGGTLRVRIKALAAPAGASPVHARFHGKTGTINSVNALSGIVEGRSGGTRYVAAVVNHHAGDSDRAEDLLDAIITRVADF